jgi:putative YhbY family RNA-binding protein
MPTLTPSQRKSLRARAHSLHPVVMIGGEGLTSAVLAEAERALAAHELIKLRAAEAERDERDALLAEVCSRTGAEPVQHIGKMLVIYRARPREQPREDRSRPASGPPERSPMARRSRARKLRLARTRG